MLAIAPSLHAQSSTAAPPPMGTVVVAQADSGIGMGAGQSLLPGTASGGDNGLGASCGAGVGCDLSARSGVVLEWQRHDFHFVGTGKDEVDLLSVGYVVRF